MGSIVLATQPSPDLTVWDISDPAQPQLLASYAYVFAPSGNIYVSDMHQLVPLSFVRSSHPDTFNCKPYTF